MANTTLGTHTDVPNDASQQNATAKRPWHRPTLEIESAAARTQGVKTLYRIESLAATGPVS